MKKATKKSAGNHVPPNEETTIPPAANKFKRLTILIAVAAVAIVMIMLFYKSNEQDNAPETMPDITKGKALAYQYCQSCHLLPEPSVLDKKTWKTLLPEMGLRLGIQTASVQYLAKEDADFYPTTPAMNMEDWQAILHYYDTEAPSTLALPQPNPAPKPVVNSFTSLSAPPFLIRPNIIASYTKIDNSTPEPRLFVFDAFSQMLYLFNSSGLSDSASINGILVDISFHNNQLLACSIGKQMQMGPDKMKEGTVFPIIVTSAGKLQIKPPLFKNLARPVQILAADFTGDKKTDYVILEFGKLTGSLTLMKSKSDGRYKKTAIKEVPGSVKAYTKTNPATGLNDLWVLFAQGDESIIQFINKGNGSFEEKPILRFPAIYGSTSFELVDMNNDGQEDILYTCGDNGDGTRIAKPYHGVYIFHNDGKGNYIQSYFYPMFGCYKAIARDYDGSGRKSIAAIAYFTEPDHPEDWFVYLKNEGNLNFTAQAPPPDIHFTSALTMDAGDFNGDGRPDLIFGNDFYDGPAGLHEALFAGLESINH